MNNIFRDQIVIRSVLLQTIDGVACRKCNTSIGNFPEVGFMYSINIKGDDPDLGIVSPHYCIDCLKTKLHEVEESIIKAYRTKIKHDSSKS